MENTVLTLKLTVEQVNMLLAGLGKLPLEVSIKLFDEIQKQSAEQLQSKAAE